MIQIGTKRRLIMDGFIIAAIAVAVINIYLLTDLMGSPIPQKSEAFKMADPKWRQYRDMQDQTLDDLIKSAETITAVADMSRQPKAENTQLMATAQDDTTNEAEKATAAMPHLSGILQIAQPAGSSRFIALMEGKRLYKNDKIMNFTIKNITAKGVLLSRKGRDIFIPAPEVYFSLGGNQMPAGTESR